MWFLFNTIGLHHPIVVLLPGVIFQEMLRCGFVALYHKVEKVIEVSIARHEQQQIQRGESEAAMAEAARLRLELNDWACGLAAGTGFGGMHAVLLYGTLLASEADNLGTLIQDSCPSIPSLLVSALNAFFFSILDIIWMLFTFFGMRRRRSPGIDGSNAMGAALGNSKASGNIALAICGITHLAASFATTPNALGGGCRVSIPLVASIVLLTVAAFYVGVYKIYLPSDQRRRLPQPVGGHHD